MRRARPDWRTLNRFVDGALGPREAAAVAEAAARDASVADDIALLHRLKDAVTGAPPPAPDDLAAALPLRAPRRRVGRVAVAAVLAAAVAAFLLVRPAEDPAGAGEAFVATARSLHAGWQSARADRPAVPMPAVLDALTRFGRLPVVPDLTSSGLSIGTASVHLRHGERILQIGYLGHNGCHLSLFVAAAPMALEATARAAQPAERLRAWRVSDLTYLLLADGMDAGRFALIARKAERAARERTPLDARDRQELAANKRHSGRCSA